MKIKSRDEYSHYIGNIIGSKAVGAKGSDDYQTGSYIGFKSDKVNSRFSLHGFQEDVKKDCKNGSQNRS